MNSEKFSLFVWPQLPSTQTNRIIEEPLNSSIRKPHFDANMSSALHHSRSNSADRKKLFVGNLPANTTLAELIELFRKYGPVNEQLSVVKDDNYAFIHFYSDKDAEAAFKAVNDSFFKNRYIRVQYSTSQGHVKKSKTFDFGRISSNLSNEENMPKSIKINKIGSSAQSSQCSSLSNMMEQQQQQTMNKLRAITGGNRCTITKSTTFSFSKTSDIWHPMPIEDNPTNLSKSQSSSLLIPADSELNKQNQLKLLSIYKQHIKHQQQQQHQQLERDRRHQQQQQQLSYASRSLYDDSLDHLNLVTKRDSAGLFIRSNTISSFNLFN